jgi:hypothetical protein
MTDHGALAAIESWEYLAPPEVLQTG